MASVIGVDACKAGWCVVSLVRRSGSWDFVGIQVLESFRDILEDEAELICVDIPIGLLDGPGHRFCDKEARRRLGRPRAASVFAPPSRAVFSHEDYVGASIANFRVTGKQLSQQSFAISRKIAEVDSEVSPRAQRRVREVHSELCFWSLYGGHPVSPGKKTLTGRTLRWRLLLGALSSLPPEATQLEVPPGCAIDDTIDALASALTVACIADNSALVIPEEQQVDARGLRMEMWFPPVRDLG